MAVYDVTLVGRFNRPRTAPAEALDVWRGNRENPPSKLPEYLREMQRYFRNGTAARRNGIVDSQDTKVTARANPTVLRAMREAVQAGLPDRWSAQENTAYDFRGVFEFKVAVQAETQNDAFARAQRYLDRGMRHAMCRSPELELL